MIGALASTATVLGAPAGPFIACGGVLILVAAIAGGVAKVAADSNSAQGILIGRMNDLSDFPSGHWPRLARP